MFGTKYFYNGLILNDSNELFSLNSISGLDSASVEDLREDRCANNGQTDYGQFIRERLITLKGNILSKFTSMIKVARQMLLDAFLNDGKYHWLKWQEDGEEAKQVYCKVMTRTIADKAGQGPIKREFTINLLAVDPRIYSQIEQVKTIQIPTSIGGFGFPLTFPLSFGTARIGGSAVCNNSGNFETLPVVRMYGPLVSPEIRNTNDNNKFIKVNIVINTGDYLEIDFDKHTIMLNGVASRYPFLDFNSRWFSILPGNNLIEFKDNGGDINGYCEIIFRSAWV